jgi:hypothetical protein
MSPLSCTLISSGNCIMFVYAVSHLVIGIQFSLIGKGVCRVELQVLDELMLWDIARPQHHLATRLQGTRSPSITSPIRSITDAITLQPLPRGQPRVESSYTSLCSIRALESWKGAYSAQKFCDFGTSRKPPGFSPTSSLRFSKHASLTLRRQCLVCATQ